ncbi:GGDEF domain-containing protein [Butyrivibrio fibrisolvens]|jgi:diguanylate cyclase (GGDEF)-like protein|uniref:GGDEF domain-containing protein n=1 Tax=Butyrivibrio fibrisolvens TaxID=831 RepID=UPI000429D723|nr:diguanylate cyclase [Butyrivibrio fibrisolvens]
MNPIKEIQKQKYADSFKALKIIQLILMILVIIVYIVLFMSVPDMRNYVEHSNLLKVTNISLFVLILIGILVTIFDLSKYVPVLTEYEEQKNKSYLDALTGIPNRFSCDLVFEMYGEDRKLSNVACAVIIINNLIDINREKGRIAGNQALVDFSWMLEDISDEYGFAGRNGGNEFLLIVENCDDLKMKEFFQKLDKRVYEYNMQPGKDSIEISYAYVINSTFHASKFSDIIAEAYRKIKENKKKQAKAQ